MLALVFELTEARKDMVGHLSVRRALPRRGRRTVGAWCFLDHMGPAQVTETSGLDVGPHPHIGLQTVTWLIEGEALHRDSLGSVQLIAPGELNLMTAGQGVAHSEEATGSYAGGLEGAQLWIAQPSATRNGPPAFEHHGELPTVGLAGGATATVLVGDLDGTVSPARHDTPLVGAELAFAGGPATVTLRPEWEYAVVVLRGRLAVQGETAIGGGGVEPGHLAYLGTGRYSLTIEAPSGTRAMLIGGEPFPETLAMWWNFVARDKTEIASARAAWEAYDDRFPAFASPLDRIPAPALV